MKNTLKYFLIALLSIGCGLLPTFAQSGGGDQPEMADGLRANGLIYVVVGVILIILAGLFVYLVSIDRKISRMEKDIDKQP
jgi:hypothetical protein